MEISVITILTLTVPDAYSRLCLRLNMRRVRKVFSDIEISLELHANYLWLPFTL